MTDERYKQLMEQVGMPNSRSLLQALQQCAIEAAIEERNTNQDVSRWNWLVRHASLGFDSAPRWSAIIRLQVFDAEDQTITALVDTARKETKQADAPKKGD